MKKNKGKQKRNVLLASAKALYTKKSLICISLDIAFIIFMILSLSLALVFANKSAEAFVDAAPSILSIKEKALSQEKVSFDREEVSKMKEVVDRLLRNIIWTLVAILVVVIMGVSFFKGIIWSRISSRPFNRQYFLRFLLVNAFWFIIWVVFSCAVLVGVKIPLNGYILFVAAFVFHYLTLVVYSRFNAEEDVGKILRDVLKTGLSKRVLSYLLILAVGFVIALLAGGVENSGISWLFLPVFLLFLAYLQWSRVYFFMSVSER